MLSKMIAQACLAYCRAQRQTVPWWVYAELDELAPQMTDESQGAPFEQVGQHTPGPDEEITRQ